MHFFLIIKISGYINQFVFIGTADIIPNTNLHIRIFSLFQSETEHCEPTRRIMNPLQTSISTTNPQGLSKSFRFLLVVCCRSIHNTYYSPAFTLRSDNPPHCHLPTGFILSTYGEYEYIVPWWTQTQLTSFAFLYDVFFMRKSFESCWNVGLCQVSFEGLVSSFFFMTRIFE